MPASWRFGRMSPAEINQDPVQGEFFSRAADLPERLVREAIQNSLDARHDAETVKVRFVFSGERDALPVPKATSYLEGLNPHIGAVVDAEATPNVSNAVETDEEVEALEDALECFDKPMTYLVVEDFGTKGLAGDTSANRPMEEDNDFWGFFRSIGISPKRNDAGGSWGLGKWVFPDASVINAYLGITQRLGEEHRWLLMGMAMLKTHLLGEAKYRPYGFFAVDSSVSEEQWLPLPIDDDDEILEACGDFSLDRINGPGLSVIIPYPKQELRPESIARAVYTQYFLPVVRGDLVVEIVHPDEAQRTINAETILHEVDRIGPTERPDASPASLSKAIELAKWAMRIPEADATDVDIENLLNQAGKDVVANLQDQYDQGDRLAFRVNMDVRPKAERTRVQSSFHIYLERADDLSEGHDYFIRGHLHLPDMDYIKGRRARALVIVDGDTPLGHMLRDSENPAHTQWDPSAQRLKARWTGGPVRVRNVRTLCSRLLRALAERPEAQQRDALADLFPGNPERRRPKSRVGGSSPSRGTTLLSPVTSACPQIPHYRR